MKKEFKVWDIVTSYYEWLWKITKIEPYDLYPFRVYLEKFCDSSGKKSVNWRHRHSRLSYCKRPDEYIEKQKAKAKETYENFIEIEKELKLLSSK